MNFGSFFVHVFLALFGLSCTEINPTNDQASTVETKPAKEHRVIIPSSPVIDSSLSETYTWLTDYRVEDKLINRITVPEGFERVSTNEGTIANWLRHLPLLPKGHKVKLYNKELKWNQKAHHAVVNMDVGTRDLQQCADAVMRLKAEYHYAQKEFDQIHFNFTSGDRVSFDDWRYGKKPRISGNRVSFSAKTGTADNSYANFKKYLIMIFSYAGTASLEKELLNIESVELSAGDVFIQGGFPGHAVLVLDVAKNESTGKTAFLLGQSYMPAQEFHVLKNPNDPQNSPWYILEDLDQVNTPEWNFNWDDLMRFGD